MALMRETAEAHINYFQVYGQPYAGTAPLIFEQFYDQKSRSRKLGLRVTETTGGHEVGRRLWDHPIIENRWMILAGRIRMAPTASEGNVQFYADMADGRGLVQRSLGSERENRFNYATLGPANYSSSTGTGNHIDLQLYWPARIPMVGNRVLFGFQRIGNSLSDILNPVPPETVANWPA